MKSFNTFDFDDSYMDHFENQDILVFTRNIGHEFETHKNND